MILDNIFFCFPESIILQCWKSELKTRSRSTKPLVWPNSMDIKDPHHCSEYSQVAKPMHTKEPILKTLTLLIPGRNDYPGAQAKILIEKHCKLYILCWYKKGFGLKEPHFGIWDVWNWPRIIQAMKTPLTLSVYKNEIRFILGWFRWLQDAPEWKPCHLLTIRGYLLISLLPTIPYPNYSYPSTLTFKWYPLQGYKIFTFAEPSKTALYCSVAM